MHTSRLPVRIHRVGGCTSSYHFVSRMHRVPGQRVALRQVNEFTPWCYIHVGFGWHRIDRELFRIDRYRVHDDVHRDAWF